MKSIVLIQPYFGNWPIWFDAHLCSIEKNPTINWLFVTDCLVPKKYPDNCQFVKISLVEFNEKVNEVLKVKVPLSTRKLCDIRPAFGTIFFNEIAKYDFWGFCDMDIIWGDIRKFITSDILDNYEIVSSRKQRISGHFSIFKNTEKINGLYRKIETYQHCLKQIKLMRCDEELLSDFLVEQKNEYAVYWPKILLNQERGRDSHQEYYLDRWMWDDGAVYEMIDGKIVKEVMYLHFINWKPNMKINEVLFTNANKQFYISHIGMHYSLHPKLQHFYNNITNIFNGYHVKEKRRYRKHKIKSLIKRIKQKLNFN